MNLPAVSRNVRLYYWYQAFSEPIFWGPILITYIIHVGKMPLADIYLMESVVVLSMIFLEVPSGALADLIGRKKTMVLGGIFALTDVLWFSCSDSPLDIWIANIFWVIGFSLKSGADSALLYDSLKVLEREKEYKQIEGHAISARLFFFACGSLIVGFLAEINLRLPLILSSLGVAASLLASFLFKEPNIVKSYSPKEQFNLIKVSILFVANHKELKWLVGFSALIAVTSKIWFFTYNPYFELVNLDLKYYGVIFFLLNIIAWFSSRYAYKVEKFLPERLIIIAMIALLALPILLMGTFVALPAVGLVLLQNFVRGFSFPFFRDFINSRIDSENRATVISIQSAINGFSQFVFLGIFGLLLNIWDLPVCLQILGLFVLFAGIIGIRRYYKIFK